ncbi:MAG: thioesterase domain-containing protein, partial [Acidobacteria bacterium]|nr:thioesterase domain-containing protein [Acidobacteriota bacterium]
SSLVTSNNKNFHNENPSNFPNDQCPMTNDRFYKTGDLARWLPAGPPAGGDSGGVIEFLGRIDQQVKIRGHRIELGEIESCLLKHHEIKEAVVTVQEKDNNEKDLCAYVVFKRDPAPNYSFTEALKEYLGKELPNYMIPPHVIAIKQLPLNPNGKVDLKALSKPGTTTENKKYTAPKTDSEKKLALIWAEILEKQVNTIGIDGDFFQLGGHSLKAAILVSKLQKSFNAAVPLIEVFTNPTIRSLAKYIENIKTIPGFQTYPIDNMVLLKPGDNDKNLFLIHDGSGEVDGYMEFCKQLTRPFNCWGLRANRFEKEKTNFCTIEQIAREYIDKIQIIQPQGPYWLVGWSLGGTIAFEMALQLEKLGMVIAFLGLLDSPDPIAVSSNHPDEIEDAGPYRLDVVKSLVEARSRYTPGQKIHTVLHYFGAGQSPSANWKNWMLYCCNPIKSYTLPGDHFSIMQKPAAAKTVEIFQTSLLSLINIDFEDNSHEKKHFH